ncbi:MAG: transcriptional regulator NrdR [Armatimonadetes bacterium]|nr:transcriptional regulator NrdR [Armatimonadota bacterium]
MKCPFCGFDDDKVLSSRAVRNGEAIRRRRECLSCARRFTTFEQIEELRVMVVKRDRSREPFDRNKVLKGMTVACEKRPVGMDILEAMADDIERAVYDSGVREIESEEIGEMVADGLRNVDQVAYVRFASVYRQFEDVGQFRDIVDILGGRRRAKKTTG